MKIEFYKHSITEQDIKRVTEVLRSRFVTTGPETEKFEKAFCSFLNVKHTLGVTSCTAGLHLLLLAFGIGKGDEVIVPSMTFVSSVNVIEYTGAKPVFADVDPDTGLIDLQDAEKKITKKTKAVIGVHLYGQMADVKGLVKLAKSRKIKIIEDAAHCIDAVRDGIKPGQISDGAAFSFYATKNITCGEGGAVVTRHKAVYEKIKVLRLHGMSKDAMTRYQKMSFQQYDVKVLGYKYNMTDIQASLLFHQLETLHENTQRREEISRYWESIIGNLPHISYPQTKYGQSARHLFTIRVNPKKRNRVIEFLNKSGIPVSVHFKPVHHFTYYKKKYGSVKLEHTEKIGASTITLPLYPQLSEKEVLYIGKILQKIDKEISSKNI